MIFQFDGGVKDVVLFGFCAGLTDRPQLPRAPGGLPMVCQSSVST